MSFPDSFCLAEDYLRASEAALEKSERTRLRVLGSTVALLDRSTSTDLLPAELAQHVGVSRTLLYHHFTDLNGLLGTIVGDFEKRNVEFFKHLPPDHTRFDYPWLVGYVAWVTAVAVRNLGVMRLMHTRTDRLPAVNDTFQRLLFEMNRALGAHIQAPAGVQFSGRDRLLIGYMAAGGFNYLLRDLFVFPNSYLPRIESKEALFDLVKLVAGFRYRLIHGDGPPADDVRQIDEQFALSFFEPCFARGAAAW